MSGGQRQCVAIARTATFHQSSLSWTSRRRRSGAGDRQVEGIIRTLKEQGKPLILISHNMRQVMDLCDRIVVWRRGRICANLKKEDTDGQDVVAYITGAKTQARIR
jgi:fructose transport system ATP-binding protein